MGIRSHFRKLYPNLMKQQFQSARQCGLVQETHADPRGDFACSLQRMFITILSAREAERKRLGQAELG